MSVFPCSSSSFKEQWLLIIAPPVGQPLCRSSRMGPAGSSWALVRGEVDGKLWTLIPRLELQGVRGTLIIHTRALPWSLNHSIGPDRLSFQIAHTASPCRICGLFHPCEHSRKSVQTLQVVSRADPNLSFFTSRDRLPREGEDSGAALASTSLLKRLTLDTYRCFWTADHLPECGVVPAAYHRLLVGNHWVRLMGRTCSWKTKRKRMKTWTEGTTCIPGMKRRLLWLRGWSWAQMMGLWPWASHLAAQNSTFMIY